MTVAGHLFSEFQALVASRKERKVDIIVFFFLIDSLKSYEKTICHLVVIFVESFVFLF